MGRPREPLREPLLAYWYQALASASGIELACNNAASAQTMLNTARREAHDPDLDRLKTVISPFDPSRVWLVKKDIDDAPPP